MQKKKIFSENNRVKSSFKKTDKINDPFNYRNLLTNNTNLNKIKISIFSTKREKNKYKKNKI